MCLWLPNTPPYNNPSAGRFMAHLMTVRDLPGHNSQLEWEGGGSLEVLPASKATVLQGDIKPQFEWPSRRDIPSAGGIAKISNPDNTQPHQQGKW